MPFWWWIRIRIRGSMPLTNGSGSLLFSSLTFKTLTKNKLKKSFSTYYFLAHLHNFSKIKNKKEVTKQWKSRFFLVECLMIKGSGSGLGSGSATLLMRHYRVCHWENMFYMFICFISYCRIQSFSKWEDLINIRRCPHIFV
jgi:hypothetical protein